MAPKMAKQPLKLVKFKKYIIDETNKTTFIHSTETTPKLSKKYGEQLISTDTPDLDRDHAE